MNINIICVGKLKEKYWTMAENEYIKRLTRFTKINLVQLQDEKLTGNTSLDNIAKEKEGEKIISKIPKNSFVIAMDIKGKQFSSEEFSKEIENLTLMGKSNLTFIIGGSLGISKKVLDIADKKLSFSKMTFPHQLFRIMLLEQIYRSFKIINNETYHK